ncbi:calcium uptake protein 3, mitochondrial-like isoform X2 [Mercenaria mercenaria]|uniref:calcium uptake protein 3, mitochondrial-like isoform X2 n=1 Tax=Mercenaria mercenaria TaxID=6596 RepID=UPI00234F46A3|nr:calcium uptake protein 3, mitochondrial-like isoform X2 [Mercenaria mercenaria]
MAAPVIRKNFLTFKGFRTNLRHIHTVKKPQTGLNTTLLIGTSCTCFVAWQAWRKYRQNDDFLPKVYAAQEPGEKKSHPMTHREERFQQFASVQCDGVIYMTPQDFLESVTEEVPRPRIGRTNLTPAEANEWLKNTPTKRRGSKTLFRSMHDKGLISYTEYLFLLCVLTKPQSGFRIAFNMFDTDGNQIVDRKEFLVLESFFTLPPHERKFVPREKKHLQALLDLEGVFSKQRDSSTKKRSDKTEDTAEKKYNLYHQKVLAVEPIQDTTLLLHFFGRRGNDVLKYEDFHKFMTNLQSEVIELEFLEFSKGMLTISEEDFANILLRYTNLDKLEIGECLERVKQRMPEEKGITFEEFRQFSQFMNSLDDFAIAMNMYTYAQQPVSKEEFQRAVKICTGTELGSHIVSTVFNMFDVDGDGHLSYKEFISIMKDRKHRGSRSHNQHTPRSWDAFKACVKNEMRSY